jgi:hypothetical protein
LFYCSVVFDVGGQLVVHFVDIGGIVDHHWSNFLFITLGISNGCFPNIVKPVLRGQPYKTGDLLKEVQFI